MPLDAFHPAVADWFRSAFGAPTLAQARAWPAIAAGRHALITAPTGSGKTLAAFLAAIDGLLREGLAGALPDTVRVLYVSPLRALAADIDKNLAAPIAGIRDQLLLRGIADVPLRAGVRTGDTPAAERERMRRRPPHLLVTTPESLYLLLTAPSGRAMLGGVRTVIVDEVHALAGSKRGAHLALSLERLEGLVERPPVRIGLSATVRPIATIERFLLGAREVPCTRVDTGHARERDLALELPRSPLTPVMAGEVWTEVYDRLAELARAHRTTLVFVNTRRLAERVARHLAERLGEDAVTAHHGSLSREHRLDAEQRLKAGRLTALVATASLELGIDIGDVDLVCQLGSPRGVSPLLQRVGRSGHGVGRVPKGRLFPLTRDDLVECTALLAAARAGDLDEIIVPPGALDVLAQQVVAEVAGAGEWDEAALLERFRRAFPYRDLAPEDFRAVLRMLADGYTTRRGRRGAYLHRDAVHGRLRPRRGARLTAATNGGAIPDQFDYDVLLGPEGLRVGSVNEDFAFESLPGDVFQLGNTSYRILRVESGRVHVEDARGQPPHIPFWFGEAPGRSEALSLAVSALRAAVDGALADGGEAAAQALLERDYGLEQAAARQLAEYLGGARAALGFVPTRERLAVERFFDELGDLHVVVHSPYGSRLNRAWGLALRKRFCRKFNFELQAAALEDSIVLSLGPTHSFALEEMVGYVRAGTARDVLTQAVLTAPMFGARWRWAASTALAVRRTQGGRRRPAQFQRQDAEDLLAVIFPDQLACAENLTGAREIPDHPLVAQALADCLTDGTDVVGLEALLARIEAGAVRIDVRDLPAPSPLAAEVLSARPYAFLDDVPAEERRTLTVAAAPPVAAVLDGAAIARVRGEAWPQARDADELHDALLLAGFLTAAEGGGHGHDGRFGELVAQRRACTLTPPGGAALWVAAERLGLFLARWPGLAGALPSEPVEAARADPQQALVELLRGRLECLGPVTGGALAAPLGLADGEMQAAFAALEQEGFVLRGRFEPQVAEEQWCERGLLARAHRYALDRRRRDIAPVSEAEHRRFLRVWQGLDEPREGPDGLLAVIEQLEGLSFPAAAWESQVLPARVRGYLPLWLDELCAQGEIAWLRVLPPRLSAAHPRITTPVRGTPVALLPRTALGHWRALSPRPAVTPQRSSAAETVRAALAAGGAAFFADLVAATGLLRTQVEQALAELVALGEATADRYSGLRALLAPASARPHWGRRHAGSRARAPGLGSAGRWSLLAPPSPPAEADRAHAAQVLLRRYGVVYRALLEGETLAPPWRELVYQYRRGEARGELRGGRFVDRVSGEQYALPEAVGALKAQRRAQGVPVVAA